MSMSRQASPSPFSPSSGYYSKAPVTARATTSSCDDNDPAASDLPVQIRIQRLAIVAGGVLCVAVVCVAMWFCVHDGGIVLKTFLSTDKDESELKKLLNKYNSYSGSLTSVLVKPVEIFAAMALAVGLLCFATELSVGEHYSSRARWLLLVATAATGYLLTNGFNAVNVQLASRPWDLVISAHDLSRRAVTDRLESASGDESDSNTSSTHEAVTAPFNKALLEETARNPSSNTALRSSFLPMEPAIGIACEKQLYFTDEQDSLGSSFGFPQHPWQSQMLPEAVESTRSLEFELGTNTTKDIQVLSSHGVSTDATELPMKNSTAINLIVRGIREVELKLKWWGSSQYNLYLDRLVNLRRELGQYSGVGTYQDLIFNASSSLSDKDVLQRAQAMLRDFFGEVANVSASEVRVELSSRNLSSGVTFDAITFEIPLVPNLLSRYLDDRGDFSHKKYRGGDWFYDINWIEDCTGSACVVNEPEYNSIRSPVNIESQVQMRSICWNYTLQEESPFQVYMSGDNLIGRVGCDELSNSSIRVVSVGKRIQGDTITIKKGLGDNPMVVQLKNPRKVYSLTVGDLSWQDEDLAKAYGAKCSSSDATLCRGLRYKLSNNQHLILGSQYLPVGIIRAATGNGQKSIPLVSFVNSQLCDTCNTIPASTDLALPRRFASGTAFLSEAFNYKQCRRDVEDYISSKETNHLYIEKSLQPAYTAAMFYLFQDGVVRDVLNISTSSSSGKATQDISSGSENLLTESLAFQLNTQLMDVKLSSPLPNVLQTLVGCVILIAICVSVGVFGKRLEAKLQRIATPHTIAEVLINDKKFPSLLVKTVVAPDDDDFVVLQEQSDAEDDEAVSPLATLEGFRVDHVRLVHPDGRVIELGSSKLRESRGPTVVVF